jgi:protein ImuB
VIVVEHDPAGAARAFEPVVAALEAFAPGVEIVRPGVCAVATRGPSRYFGGDEALAAKVKAQLSTNAAANGSSIEVTARNGVVLLEGSVPTMAIKQRALAAARSTDGVTQVVDRIRVGAKR